MLSPLAGMIVLRCLLAARGERSGQQPTTASVRTMPWIDVLPSWPRLLGIGQPAASSSSICVARYSASASFSSRSASSAWRLTSNWSSSPIWPALSRSRGKLLVVDGRRQHRALQAQHALALALQARPQPAHVGLGVPAALPPARPPPASASVSAWPIAASLRLKSGSGTETDSVVSRSRAVGEALAAGRDARP